MGNNQTGGSGSSESRTKRKQQKESTRQTQSRPQANPVINTAQNIKQTITKLEKRRDFVQKKIDVEHAQAKVKAKANNKQGALLHLKKKKVYEQDATKLEGMIFSLEQQVMAVESGSVNYDVVKAMREGVSAQKKMNEQIDVDKTAEMMDEMKELQEDMNEVSDLLAQPIDEITSDEDLLKELGELNIEDLEAEVDAVSKPVATTTKAKVETQVHATEIASNPTKTKVQLPDAPKHKVEAVIEEDDDEAALRALQAEME